MPGTSNQQCFGAPVGELLVGDTRRKGLLIAWELAMTLYP